MDTPGWMSVHDISVQGFDDMVLDKVDLQDALLLLTLLVYLPLILTSPYCAILPLFSRRPTEVVSRERGPLLADRADVAD